MKKNKILVVGLFLVTALLSMPLSFAEDTTDAGVDLGNPTDKHCIKKAGGTMKCTWRLMSSRPVCSSIASCRQY
ncbi:hypothetical protein [Carboxylicivirga sp. N1Y90]|uniref:hypothetical protein n=1 Tax=Carboxylicivirga fragile TaxID=3417571 RepID=UPI003D337D5A|nr:hypothetical protein [Marinilabiliaceae bacterium N1Y90]